VIAFDNAIQIIETGGLRIAILGRQIAQCLIPLSTILEKC